MSPKAGSQPQQSLKRQLGIPGAIALGLGSIVGTGVFVSIGLAAGIALLGEKESKTLNYEESPVKRRVGQRKPRRDPVG